MTIKVVNNTLQKILRKKENIQRKNSQSNFIQYFIIFDLSDTFFEIFIRKR